LEPSIRQVGEVARRLQTATGDLTGDDKAAPAGLWEALCRLDVKTACEIVKILVPEAGAGLADHLRFDELINVFTQAYEIAGFHETSGTSSQQGSPKDEDTAVNLAELAKSYGQHPEAFIETTTWRQVDIYAEGATRLLASVLDSVGRLDMGKGKTSHEIQNISQLHRFPRVANTKPRPK